MIRDEILEQMTPEERRELHYLVIDARQYHYDNRRESAYKRAAEWESALIRIGKKLGDYK